MYNTQVIKLLLYCKKKIVSYIHNNNNSLLIKHDRQFKHTDNRKEKPKNEYESLKWKRKQHTYK